jgi:hypothetical protein
MIKGLLGGRLYHCVYCRIQFYDLRHSIKNAPGKQDPDSNPAALSGTAR